MAISKSDVELKRNKRREKKEKIDKLTNWYMINLSWGVVGLIALGFVESAYNGLYINTVPTVMKVLAAILFVFAAVLFALGRANVIKNTKRANNYAIFMAVVGLIGLWIGFYAKIRNFVVGIIPSLGYLRSEWWYAWSIRYVLVVYLVVAFIVITIKTTLADRR